LHRKTHKHPEESDPTKESKDAAPRKPGTNPSKTCYNNQKMKQIRRGPPGGGDQKEKKRIVALKNLKRKKRKWAKEKEIDQHPHVIKAPNVQKKKFQKKIEKRTT